MTRRAVTVNSPGMRRIVASLERCGPMDAEEIAIEACVAFNTLRSGKYLKALLDHELIHIVKYRRSVRGPALPTYAAGPGKNASPPKKYSNAQKAKRWKQKVGYNRNRAEALRTLSKVFTV